VTKIEVWPSISVFVSGHLDVPVVRVDNRSVVQLLVFKRVEKNLEVIERYLLRRSRRRRRAISRSVRSHHDRLLQSNHVRVGRLNLLGQKSCSLRELSLVVAIEHGLFYSPGFPIGKPLRRVEPRGIEPLTSALPARRSPS
jgi:hypothetical protein